MTIRLMTIDDYDNVYALWKTIGGFGLRSIRRIADKHSGMMSVRTEGSVFKLTVVMNPAVNPDL